LRKKTKIRLGVLLGTVLTLSLISQFTSCGWLIYHAPSFSGQVIDIDTKGPIEGAVVEAFYYDRGGFALGAGGGPELFAVRETLTDKEGNFVVAPHTRLINPFTWGHSVTFRVYKPGYAPSGANEAQFSKDGFKHIDEYSWYPNKTKTIKFHDGVFELPRLETKEDRKEAWRQIEPDRKELQALLLRKYHEEAVFIQNAPNTIP
jgi:hypothetical protein